MNTGRSMPVSFKIITPIFICNKCLVTAEEPEIEKLTTEEFVKIVKVNVLIFFVG